MSSADDKEQSLDQLSEQHGKSVISQLVQIGDINNQEKHDKFLTFVENLQCLQPGGDALRRTSINAINDREYVALSYTWNCSRYENGENGGYNVQDWESPFISPPSGVRNCVFDRILHYMRQHKIELLWIDRHCIRQDECPGGPNRPCPPGHLICAQKRDALQAMDLVYQFSNHPVALLGRPINDASELRLLHRILSGGFVRNRGSKSSAPRVSLKDWISQAREALSLLHEITLDDWWRRAWTFQENYRGGKKTQLLIRHSSSLEKFKLYLNRGSGVLGVIPGELQVPSVTFFEQATLLCQAFRKDAGCSAVADHEQQLNYVEHAAGRYQHLLPKSSSMTPSVLADVESRELSQPWDRLAIVANCCRYPIRLDRQALCRQDHSLSLSLLAMCIVNGEILDNGDDNDAAVSVGGLTASGSLKELMLKKFQAPGSEPRHLTFNKGCRLTDVKLRASGVATHGHLWELGLIINTANFGKLPLINEPAGFLELEERRLLLQLVLHLRDSGHYKLANRLDEYLEGDNYAFCAGNEPKTFTGKHLLTMAKELATAINARRKLRLGRIWYPQRSYNEYSAIFILPDQSQSRGAQRYPLRKPAFVFTSVRQRDEGSYAVDANDTDCYVSLGVDIEEPRNAYKAPKLRIRSWLLGMCFFQGFHLMEVVFPWPKALQGDRK